MKDKRFDVIISEKNPELLIITPLRRKDKIRKECEESILKQKFVKKVWTSFRSKNSASYNRIEGYKKSKNFLRKNLPPYILFCDNDIVWSNEAFRKMIDVLKNTEESYGYVYCSFAYEGFRNFQFKARPFNAKLLMMRNYISTMSIQKISVWKKFGRFDLNLERYQDWDLWLNYLSKSIIGIPCYDAYFIAISSKSDISMKPDKNYRHLSKIIEKYNLPIEVVSNANL